MTKINFLGHSAVCIEGNKIIYIDPFLNDNPVAKPSPKQIKIADIVIITHNHADHIGDAYEICRKTGSILVGIHEIAVDAENAGIKSEGMNIGGTINVEGVVINMVNANHSCMNGHAAGVVLEMDGFTIYHPGDTGLFGDMRIMGEFFNIDLAFLPIGDRYTMGIKSAAKAVEYLKPEKVIPIHYNTFPVIQADPYEFKKLVGSLAEVLILNPGEYVEL